jgi:predicted NAD/FAD-dependent oxidoreductase
MRSPADALAGQLLSWKHRRVVFLNRLDSSLLELGFEDGGSEGPYDLVILNMPPKQCEPFLTALSSSLTEQVRSVEMTPCWALMLSFAEHLDVSFDAAFVSGGAPLSWIARDSSKPGRPPGERWVVHGSAEWSQAHLEDEAAAVEAALTDAFYRFLALSPDSAHSQTQGRLPEVTFRKAHRWRYAIAANPLEVGALIDAANKIAICGDWLVQNRVEGAFLSGLTCAGKVQQIFQRLQSPLPN